MRFVRLEHVGAERPPPHIERHADKFGRFVLHQFAQHVDEPHDGVRRKAV